MNKILNYLEDDNWYKIFDAENDEDIEYKLLEREEVETLLKEIERLNKELAFERQIKKEAREYIELGMNFDSLGVYRTKKELLEILDKENK